MMTATHQDRSNAVASMEERMASVEATLPHLATKADIKDLEVRLTRLIYAVGVGILVSIALSLARFF